MLEVLLIFLVFVLFDPTETHFKLWKNFIATGGVNSLLFTSLNFLWYKYSLGRDTTPRKDYVVKLFLIHGCKQKEEKKQNP